jgi:osmotically-inducible protein OsmY
MRRLCLLLVLFLFTGMLPGCAPLGPPPAGSVFEDENIENQAISQINSHHTGTVHVNVTCFKRRLLLTGEVPSEASKSEIEKIVSGVANVRAINNELVVGSIRGIASRTSDSLVTSDVKLRFVKEGAFRTNQVKIITENGTVFLMGSVHRKEAASAAELASTTNGVQRVVMLFEYLD